MNPRKNFEWKLKGRGLRLGDRTLIMGSINVAPDSGSGGLFTDPDRAYAHAMMLEEQGADVIELSAETLKNGVARIAEAEELRRLIPVVKLLRDKLHVPLCISTWKSAVAEKALEHGAAIISDPSSMAWDPAIAKAIIKYDAGLILVHLRGTPDSWGTQSPVKDLISMVHIGLGAALHRAMKTGIAKDAIIIDPGLGLGKRREQNYDVINQLGVLRQVDRPILICTSRKAFLAKPDAQQMEFASTAMMTAAILNGAHMVRVHDVKGMKAAVEATDALVAATPVPVEPPPRGESAGPKPFGAQESERRPNKPPLRPMVRPLSGPLAMGAKVGAPLRNQNAFDGRGAGAAGLPSAPVNAVEVLETPAVTVAVDVVGDGRPAHDDGLPEQLLDGAVEAPQARFAELSADQEGMQTGPKQGLVDVDVAQAPKKLLIEQEGLETGAATGEERGKAGEGDFERIGALRGVLGGPGDAAKATDVVKE